MSEDSNRERQRIVRPRNAGSLILLRETGGALEVLLGRRSASARFMPGRYVFPGGSVQRDDSRPWLCERDGTLLLPTGTLRSAARAALRETFEETGFVVGPQHAGGNITLSGRAPSAVEAAYVALRRIPDLGALRLVGRAITPTFSPIRFHARFFMADGGLAAGPLHRGDELEAVDWYSLAAGFPAPMSNVTQFMLRHAMAIRQGTGRPALPFYRHIGRATRIEWHEPGAQAAD